MPAKTMKTDCRDKNLHLAVLLLSCAVFALLTLRTVFQDRRAAPQSPAPVIVEVKGNVPRPGVYLLARGSATFAGAIAAAGVPGGLSSALESRELADGESLTLVYRNGSPEIVLHRMPAATLLASGLKLDVNTASETDLGLIPLMRPEVASAIVERRGIKPWESIDELEQIHGVGPKTAARLRDYLQVQDPPGQPTRDQTQD